MIKTEFYKEREDGVKLYRTYSDSGKMIERDGNVYDEAIDPEGSGRTYTEVAGDETDISAEEALSIITGGEV